jgi:hypothetical protein
MFGSKKIQELEDKVRELTESLSKQQAENADLTQQLDSAKSRIAGMEAQLRDFNLEQAVEEARASRAEFEGLKELYSRKNREFDEFKEEEEQRFARDQALQRHNLENEIRDNRQANQDYVTSTVKTFGESYNYYLNQIKVLMDALGNVATRTGEALFSGGNADLRASFGHQMRDLLKSGVEGFVDDEADIVVEAEDAPEMYEDAVAEAYRDAMDETAQAVEDAAGEAKDAAEDAADKVEEAEDAAEVYQEKLKSIDEETDEP